MPKQTMNDLAQALSDRATVIVDDGHSVLDIMKSAFEDFKSLGSMAGVMSVMSTGKLNQSQIEVSKRIVAKVLAVIYLHEKNK
ncbi:MAG: hypothetical protein ACRCUH_15040 [Shewanella sp.]